MIPAESTARTLIDAGDPVPPGIAAALLDELDLHRRLQTLGGKPPPVDTKWANKTIEPPPSASDEQAPPLRTGRGSDSGKSVGVR